MYVRRVELIPKTCRSFPNPGALFKKETSFFRGILTPPLVRFQAKSGWGEEPQLLLLFSTSKMQLSVACELARGREKETHTRQSNFMPLITTRFPYTMPFFEFPCTSSKKMWEREKTLSLYLSPPFLGCSCVLFRENIVLRAHYQSSPLPDPPEGEPHRLRIYTGRVWHKTRIATCMFLIYLNWTYVH